MVGGLVPLLDTRYSSLPLYYGGLVIQPHLQPLAHWRAFHLVAALSTLLQLLLMLFKVVKWMHLSVEQRLATTIAENSLNVNGLATRFLLLLLALALLSALSLTNLWSEEVDPGLRRGWERTNALVLWLGETCS